MPRIAPGICSKCSRTNLSRDRPRAVFSASTQGALSRWRNQTCFFLIFKLKKDSSSWGDPLYEEIRNVAGWVLAGGDFRIEKER